MNRSNSNYPQRCIAVVTLALAATLFFYRTSLADVGIFADGLMIPQGVVTDSAGNVYVHSDGVHTTFLTKYTPQGAPVARANLGGINVSEFVGSRLTRIPGSDYMLLLSPQGVIYYFTPDLQGGQLHDLRPVAGQVANDVFDILRQEFRSLVLGFPQYGDIAARLTPDEILEVFVSATTGAAGGFPFVLRLHLDLQSGSSSTRVVLTSQGTTAGNVNLAPGLAVNQDGVVLTTLPFPSGEGFGGFVDGLVAFKSDFPENTDVMPRVILRDFASAGMTVDATGNFYIATGVVGTSHCGVAASGALVFLDKGATKPTCFPITFPIGRSADVAVSPIDNSVYMTISEFNGAVLRFDPIVPITQ